MTARAPSEGNSPSVDAYTGDERPGGALASITLPVDGLHCASCVHRAERAITGIHGVDAAHVNLATGRATITLAAEADRAPLPADRVPSLVTAIEGAGFTVPRTTLDLSLTGLHCASCVGRVERALLALPGVLAAHVNLARQKAHVDLVANIEPGDGVTAARLVDAVRRAGFDATGTTDTPDQADREQAARAAENASLTRSVWLAAVLTIPVVVLEMGGHMIPAFHHWIGATIGEQTSWLLQGVLTTLVLFGPGQVFFRRGIPALIRRTPDMNALVALGTGAAWGYSTVATLVPAILPAGTRAVYFEAAAVIVSLILVGRLLEARAKGRTSLAIRRLLGLKAKTARVLSADQVVDRPIDQVRPGDRVLIRPGERVPIDGVVTDGHSYVDEAMITGEPVPALKAAGSTVVGGTLNKTGSITVQATAVGAATVLAQIIRMVESAQATKLPIQALVDRVTAVFVPVVLGIAATTFAVWLFLGPDPALTFALVNAVAVLIIACPCAMGLATPTAIMVGTGRAAELGVLFRKGEALQRLRGVQVVAFDKTGTITEGAPALTDLIPCEGMEGDQVLLLAAAVEQHSEHPIGRALVDAAEARGLKPQPVTEFEALPGYGVTARVIDRHIAIGSGRLMDRLGITIDNWTGRSADLAADAKTPLYIAIDGRLAALVAVADPIKSGAQTAIAALKAQGLMVALVTGDAQRTAGAVAQTLGIDTFVAEVLPGDKVNALSQLRQQAGGQPIAFVGDGINDAPALASADVGIAIGTGTDVAIESADVVLMSGDIAGVVTALTVSRATLRIIQQNLFWAFAYNVSLIPVAAGLLFPLTGTLLNPMLAGAAMAASSVCVVANALRLRSVARPEPIGSGRTTTSGATGSA